MCNKFEVCLIGTPGEPVLFVTVHTSDLIIKSNGDFRKKILFHYYPDFVCEMELNSFNKQTLRAYRASYLGSMPNIFLVIMFFAIVL